jgi:hypothetical protein
METNMLNNYLQVFLMTAETNEKERENKPTYILNCVKRRFHAGCVQLQKRLKKNVCGNVPVTNYENVI